MAGDKHAIKNMKYWKQKNNIPGIEMFEKSGLVDGRAGSSAFQMETPSPNKNIFKNFLQGKGGFSIINPVGAAINRVTGAIRNRNNPTNQSLSQGQNQVVQPNVVDAMGAMGAMGGMGGGVGNMAPTQPDVDQQNLNAGSSMGSGFLMKGDSISNNYGVGNILEGELGPLEQEMPEENMEEQNTDIKGIIPGQYLEKTKDGWMMVEEASGEKIMFTDPKKIIENNLLEDGELPQDLDFQYNSKNEIVGINVPETGE